MKVNKALLSGSIYLLIAINLYFVLNFFFHFAMARMLTITDYGILVTLYSIMYFIGISSESIQTVITKYSSVEGDEGRLKNLFKRAVKKGAWASIWLFIPYLLLSFPLAYLLKISYPLVAITGLLIFSAFLLPIGRGVMQGRKMFKSLGINMIIEAALKITLAILLVFLGWRVYGAIVATVLGSFIAFAFVFFTLKKILKAKERKKNVEGIYEYTTPVFFVTLATIAFFSLDVIIAKIVFSGEVAGYYAISSTLGKILFFGTQAISKAMFPFSAEVKSIRSKKTSNIFANAFTFLIVCIIVALGIFYLFPEILVRIFAGRFIPESSAILFFVAIGFGLLSITNLILLYKLSLGKIKGAYYLLSFVLIEILLLLYFSQNLFQFSIAFVTASAIFLWGSILLMNT